MHVVIKGDTHTIKHSIREELKEHGIEHVTLELEEENEQCHEEHCHVDVVFCGHKHLTRPKKS